METNGKRILPAEFLKRFKENDPEVVRLWNNLVRNLHKAKMEVKPYMQDYRNILARLEGGESDNAWILNAGMDALEETDPDAVYGAMKRSFDLHFMNLPGQTELDPLGMEIKSESLTHELPIEWDVLAAVSEDCLTGREKGFLEKEVVKETAASVVWRLRHHDLGDFGTFEVRKIRTGWSQIRFSGFEFMTQVSDEQREVKNKHMHAIIISYYYMLARENIWTGRTQIISPPLIDAETKRERQPWMRIPNRNNDRAIVRLWCKDVSVKEIADKFFLKPATVNNIIFQLRRKYPDAQIPKRFNRKKGLSPQKSK